jgi:hypothetical protein
MKEFLLSVVASLKSPVTGISNIQLCNAFLAEVQYCSNIMPLGSSEQDIQHRQLLLSRGKLDLWMCREV